jgi:outer membrane protein OmpA-like peptidoglycan-associated protein/opacity protein-like surface antigen
MAGFRLRLITGTAVALTGAVCAGTALADTKLGLYVAVDAGHDLSSSQSLKVTDVTLTSQTGAATPPAPAGTYTLKPDYAAEGFARLGYRFTPNLRAEIELGTRPGTVINGLGGNTTADLGSFDKTSLMANAIFDFRPDWGVHPFVGVGAGVVRVNTDYRETGATTGHTFSYSMAGDKTVPAGQVLAGASWDVTKSLHFDMTYRYLRTASTSYDVAMSDTHGNVTDAWTAKANGPIEDQSLSVGLRWTFGQESAPPPAPRYAEAPPRPASKGGWMGLHLPSMSLPFTRSRKTPPVETASLQPAAAVADPTPTAPPPPVVAAAAPPAPAPAIPPAAITATASEADAAPGTDAAATAKEPKRLFAPSARAPGKGKKTRAAKPAPAPAAAQVDPTPQTAMADAAPQAAVAGPAPAATPATGAITPGAAPTVPAQPASTITSSALAAPAQAPKSRRFTAYFPLGGAHLDGKAQAVVSDAAQHAQSAADVHVRVDGFADTSGSAAYNMGLSRRRATAVADALKAGGVAPETITVAWHGETQPAVKTGNGVKSAKNRRVTIGVHFGKTKPRAHHRHHRRHRRH